MIFSGYLEIFKNQKRSWAMSNSLNSRTRISELWLVGLIWLAICFHTTQELKMVSEFYTFKWLKTNEKYFMTHENYLNFKFQFS